MSRIQGHALRSEGAPHMPRSDGWERVGHWSSVGGLGHGLCECGAFSPLAWSSNTRKRWHREHKAEVAANST